MPDYSKGVIYTIRCRNDTSLIYVGSTVQPLAKRLGQHKKDCYKKASNMMLYQKIRETSWDDWYIELYEEYPCENIQQLHKREGEIIREISNLNHNVPGRTPDERVEYKKQWYQDHKEQEREYYKEKVTCEC
eukprot:358393-Hanusia_phi.AAC.1